MTNHTPPKKIIMDLETLNTYNSRGCAACNGTFALGETVVMACGPWPDGPRLIHANEAVFDPATGQYMERSCTSAPRPKAPL